jgi:hypothetical protein
MNAYSRTQLSTFAMPTLGVYHWKNHTIMLIGLTSRCLHIKIGLLKFSDNIFTFPYKFNFSLSKMIIS